MRKSGNVNQMIAQNELATLLAALESDRVERTESFSKTDKFAEAITAFANDLPDNRLPGYLLIGARDDGTLTGFTVTDQLLISLASLRSDGNIQPLPAMNVASFSFPEGELAVVEVYPSDLPPVRYKGQVRIRVGPRKAVASEQEERILTAKRIAHAKTFDALPCLGSKIEELATDVFSISYLPLAIDAEVLAENHRDLATQLASLRFFDSARGCPTHAGILLFGKNPLEWLPGAYIQFLRFGADTLASDVLVEKSLSGDLLTVLRDLESLIELHISQHPADASLLQERQVSEYPAIALREILMNAVLHRAYESTAPVRVYWFSDRVEIQSPSGLYGEASPANFPRQNSYRNPVVAEAMKTLGFVNKFGRGVVRAQDALAKNGNPPAEFQFDPGYVCVVIRKKQ